MGRIRKPFLTAILLILLFHTSSGNLELGKDIAIAKPPNTAYLLSKMETRGEMEFTVLDYDYGGHNGKHEHIRGKPGGTSGKNP